MAIRTTTYLCRSDECARCQSRRASRGVGEYQIHPDGSETLINCSDCHLKRREPRLLFPHAYKRVNRDVACRYIAMFGGATFSVQTDADDCDIYLRDKHGETIASVSMLNRFPEPVDESLFSEMPF